MTTPEFGAAADLLDLAVTDRAFPAAVAEVGSTRGVYWQVARGTLTGEVGAPRATIETVFDLASLTKPIATTTVCLRAVQAGKLGLEDAIQRWLPAWRVHDRRDVTVEDLLAHCSGLTAHVPLYRDVDGRPEFEALIGSLPLEYPPRSQALYSDLGFILLGFVLHDVCGHALDVAFADVCHDASFPGFCFRPPLSAQGIAPTGVDRWRGRLLVGEVHDRNAWALGGVAGHAGLFGTVESVGAFARAMLAALRDRDSPFDTVLVRRFCERTTVPGSSRALGWDTMMPTSSCGTRMSPAAVGHTGYTGVSLWIDWPKDVYVVLLTNRVHPTDKNEAILRIRPRFHDAIMDALSR